jgi:hypothetical protein
MRFDFMERSWIFRRIIVYAIIVSCLAMLFVALIIGGSDLVVQSIVQGAFMTLISVAGAYLGVAEWSDRNKAKELLSRLPPMPPPTDGERQ